MLTKCNDDQFSCQDGSCIPYSSKCNIRKDCPDGFDELNCRKFSIEKLINYKKLTPPATIQEKGEIESLHVKVSMDILTISKIEEILMTFSVKLQLHVSWFDSRITWIDLRKNRYSNILSLRDSKALWVPPLSFILDI